MSVKDIETGEFYWYQTTGHPFYECVVVALAPPDDSGLVPFAWFNPLSEGWTGIYSRATGNSARITRKLTSKERRKYAVSFVKVKMAAAARVTP